MWFNVRFPIVLFLLIGLSSCGGFQRKPQEPVASPTPTESPEPQNQETPVVQPSTSPSAETTPEAVAKSEKENPEPDKTPASEENSTSTAAPAPSSAPSPVLPDVPKLTAEEKEEVNKIALEVANTSGVVTENRGVITMNRVLLEQQAQWLISGTFNDDFKTVASDLPQETLDYKFEIKQADGQKAIVVAIAQNDKLPSFTGASFAVPAGLPVSGLCKSKLPSKTPPEAPTFEDNQMLCGNDGVLVE